MRRGARRRRIRPPSVRADGLGAQRALRGAGVSNRAFPIGPRSRACIVVLFNVFFGPPSCRCSSRSPSITSSFITLTRALLVLLLHRRLLLDVARLRLDHRDLAVEEGLRLVDRLLDVVACPLVDRTFDSCVVSPGTYSELVIGTSIRVPSASDASESELRPRRLERASGHLPTGARRLDVLALALLFRARHAALPAVPDGAASPAPRRRPSARRVEVGVRARDELCPRRLCAALVARWTVSARAAGARRPRALMPSSRRAIQPAAWCAAARASVAERLLCRGRLRRAPVVMPGLLGRRAAGGVVPSPARRPAPRTRRSVGCERSEQRMRPSSMAGGVPNRWHDAVCDLRGPECDLASGRAQRTSAQNCWAWSRRHRPAAWFAEIISVWHASSRRRSHRAPR